MALLTVLDFPLETTCSCKQDTKERYWGQQFWQMETDISVRPTEMTRLVTGDRLQSCVPGFSNFVFRVLVFRRSGVPAFRHSGVPCFSVDVE